MSEATVAPRERQIQTSISISHEHDKMLDSLAAAVGAGNRSKAIAYLIDLHAGREILKAEERALEEPDPNGYRVVQWSAPKLSSDMIGYVAGLVRAGCLPDTAMELVGITPSQRSRWLKKGKHDRANGARSLEADFVAAIARAEAECEVEDIIRLRKMGETSVTALTWRLERQYPDKFGKRMKVDRSLTTNVFPAIDFDKLTTSEHKLLIELLRKATPDEDDPMLSRTLRPPLELLPPEVIDGDAVEITEAPALDEAEAPALDDAEG